MIPWISWTADKLQLRDRLWELAWAIDFWNKPLLQTRRNPKNMPQKGVHIHWFHSSVLNWNPVLRRQANSVLCSSNLCLEPLNTWYAHSVNGRHLKQTSTLTVANIDITDSTIDTHRLAWSRLRPSVGVNESNIPIWEHDDFMNLKNRIKYDTTASSWKQAEGKYGWKKLKMGTIVPLSGLHEVEEYRKNFAQTSPRAGGGGGGVI